MFDLVLVDVVMSCFVWYLLCVVFEFVEFVVVGVLFVLLLDVLFVFEDVVFDDVWVVLCEGWLVDFEDVEGILVVWVVWDGMVVAFEFFVYGLLCGCCCIFDEVWGVFDGFGGVGVIVVFVVGLFGVWVVGCVVWIVVDVDWILLWCVVVGVGLVSGFGFVGLVCAVVWFVDVICVVGGWV